MGNGRPRCFFEAPLTGANRLQSMLWLTSDRYKEVIEDDRARERVEVDHNGVWRWTPIPSYSGASEGVETDHNGAGRWTPGIPSHSWHISCLIEFITFTFLRIREPSSLRLNSIVLLILQFLGANLFREASKVRPLPSEILRLLRPDIIEV